MPGGTQLSTRGRWGPCAQERWAIRHQSAGSEFPATTRNSRRRVRGTAYVSRTTITKIVPRTGILLRCADRRRRARLAAAPVSKTAALSAPMNIDSPPGPRFVEDACSQLSYASAFTNDSSACTLTGDSIEKEAQCGRWAYRKGGELGAESLRGASFNGRLWSRLRRRLHLLHRFRSPVRLLKL